MPNPWDSDPIVGSPGPIYGAPPKAPPVPSGYAGDASGLHPIPGGPADHSNQQPVAPRGYRFKGSNLEPIPGGPADPNKDAPTVGASPVSGPDYLKQLDAGTANMVKALAEGRKAFPAGAALRAPYWQEMLAHVSNYDPGFDEVNYTSRSATRRDFTSGKAANNIRALNTAIGHLGHLSEQVDGTASHSLTPVNALENTALRLTGNPGPTNFDATVSALAGELTAVYRGSGGAEADIQRYVQQLSPNASKAQKVGTIRNIVGLLKSRLDALNDQYRQGMGTTAQQLQLLDPQAQLIVNHLGGFDAAGAPGNGPPPPGGSSGGPPPNMPNDPLTPAGGGTKEVVDPNLTPIRREYLSRLQAGQTGAQLVGFLRSAGVDDPKLLQAAQEQAAFRRKNPNVPIQQFDTSAIDHLTQKMSLVNRAVNAAGQTDVGAAVAGAGNAATAGFMPDIIGATGGNETQARIAMQQQAQDHPTANLVGSIAGGTAAALGGEAALGAGGMAAGVGRSLLADTLYGSAAGAGASPDNRVGGAVMGGVAGLGGSLLGQGVAKGTGAAFRGVTNKSVNAMADAGVPLTVGQAAGQSGRVGNIVKGVEDRLSGIPGVGNMIQARRAEGMAAFNSKAFDKALGPINGSVKGAVGEEAVANARQTVSDAFSAALKGKTAVLDQKFIQASRGPMERLASIRRDNLGQEIVGQIEEATRGYFDETGQHMSGENMQAFLDALRQIRQSYKNDPLYGRIISPSIKGIESSVTDMFSRQAPEVVPAFNAAKAAYRRVSVLADAVDKGKQTEGVFTPAQLGMADRGNARRFDGKMSASSGESPFFDYQRAAQNVLPNKVPDSGTAGRLAVMAAPGALTGAGAGVGFLAGDTKSGAETGLGLTGILALAYTKTGQKRLAAMLLSRNPQARAIAEAITKRVPIAGAAGTALTQTSAGP